MARNYKTQMHETLRKAETLYTAFENNEPTNLSSRHLNRFINVHLQRELFINMSDEEISTNTINGISNMQNYIKKVGLFTTFRSRKNKPSATTTKTTTKKKSHGHVAGKAKYGYVYFLKLASQSAVKIGHAGVLWKRVKQFEKLYDFDLPESFYVKCRPGLAHKVEQYLHFLYGDYGIKNEHQMDGANEFFDEAVMHEFKSKIAPHFHIQLKHAVEGVYDLETDEKISIDIF